MSTGERVLARAALGAWPLVWIVIALVSAGGWFVTGTRLMRLAGFDGASPALGAVVAAVVVIVIWRWARQDRVDRDLMALVCPRCAGGLAVTHDHARSHGALARGLTQWRCEACGYDHSRALTCERCAA